MPLLPCPLMPALQIDSSQSWESVQRNIAIGKMFAFYEKNLLEGAGLEWLGQLVGSNLASPRRVVPLLGSVPVDLPGARHQGLAPHLELMAVLSDKALYRDKEVVHLLVIDPARGGVELDVEVCWNGTLLASHCVQLGLEGMAAWSLRDLPEGDYALRFRGDEAPRCEFQVAQYRLAPLVAHLVERRYTGQELAVTLRVESFGIPVEGEVLIEVWEGSSRADTTRAICQEGLLETQVALRGSGAHRLNLQLAEDAALTATVPLVGTRAEERSLTTFSTLGQEVKGTLLPLEGTAPVRGLYLEGSASHNSPIQLERVDTARGQLTARIKLGPTTVVVLDPTWREGPPEARNMHHPSTVDELYKTGEDLFRAGQWAEAVEPLLRGWRAQASPHPYYAYGLACAMARLSRPEEALGWLEQAVRDGWWEWEQLAVDGDLFAVFGHPRFNRIVNRGRTVLEFAELQAGQSVEFDVPRPMGIVAVGTFQGDTCWEGWACLVAPEELEPRLVLPGAVKPGESASIRLEGAEGASVYLVVKDARLASTDTPISRLGMLLKGCAEEAGALLSEGHPNRTRLSTLAAQAIQERPGSAYGGSGGWAAGPFAAPDSLAFRGSEPFRSGSSPSVDAFAYSPSGADPFASTGVDPFMSSVDPFGSSGDPFGGGPATADPFGSPPVTRAGNAGNASSLSGPPLAPAPQTSVAIRPAAAELEVLFAGLVPVENGVAVCTFTAPEEASDLTVEAFLLRGLDWAQREGRVRIAVDPWLALEIPPFVQPGDGVRGRVRAGTFQGQLTVRVTRDGEEVGRWQAERQLCQSFPVEPGSYEAHVRHDGGEEARRRGEVSAPGTFRRLVRTLTFLQPQEIFHSDPQVQRIRVLPGLDQRLTALAQATASYEHCCCEQTAGRLIGALSVYGTGDSEQRAQAESSIMAGLARMQSMWIQGRGFRTYPHSGDQPDTYWGPQAARHLWYVHLLRELPMSVSLERLVKAAWSMTEDVTRAYGLSLPPAAIKSCQDAYWVARLAPKRSHEALAFLGPELKKWADWFARDRVSARVNAAFAAAALFRLHSQLDLALQLANRVTQDLNESGRLYSTCDSVAALAMMAELKASGLVGEISRVRVDGIEGRVSQVDNRDPKQVECLEGVAVLEIARMRAESWAEFASTVALAVDVQRAGRSAWTVRPGQSVDLVVRLESGYEAGDMVWICLPEALSRVVGGGQVKRFSLDFEGASELRVPLAVTGDQPGRQSFSVCVRNMYAEERAGNPGLLTIEVKAG